MVIKYILSVIFPCPPSIKELAAQHLKRDQERLHLLELHHLDTIAALEHYEALKGELLERIDRLAVTAGV